MLNSFLTKSMLTDSLSKLFGRMKCHKRRCSNTVFCVYLRKLLRNSGKFYRLRQNKTVFMLNIAQYYTIFMSNIAQYQKIYLNFGPILFRKHKKLQYYISSLWHFKKPKSGLTIFRYNPKSTLFIAYWYSYTIRE